MNYPKAVRIIRAAKGINQQDLAKISGLSKSLLSKIEAGERVLSEKNKLKLAKSLCIPISLLELLALEQDEASVPKNDLEFIGSSLLKISADICQLNEKTF